MCFKRKDYNNRNFQYIFANVVDKIKIPSYIGSDFKETFENVDGAVTAIIAKFKTHPSINKIKSFVHNRYTFKFQPIGRECVLREIRSLNASKTCQEKDVLSKVIKESDELFADFIILLLMNLIFIKIYFLLVKEIFKSLPFFKKDSNEK